MTPPPPPEPDYARLVAVLARIAKRREEAQPKEQDPAA